jgi:WD40 repeat protein
VWDAHSGVKLVTLRGHTDRVCSVAVSENGKLALTGAYDKTAVLWDAVTGDRTQTFAGHSDAVTGVALSRDGKRVATATDNTAILWNAGTGEKLRTFDGHANPVDCVALSQDGRAIAPYWVICHDLGKTAAITKARGACRVRRRCQEG